MRRDSWAMVTVVIYIGITILAITPRHLEADKAVQNLSMYEIPISNMVQLPSYVITPNLVEFVAETSKEIEVKKPLSRNKEEQLPSKDYSNNDLELLSRLIMAEVGGESYECMVAVGEIVLNRVKSDKFPNTIKGVIYQAGQFSVVKNGSIKKKPHELATKAAQKVLNGSHSIPDDVLYFRADYFFANHKKYKKMDNTYFSY